MACQMSFVQDLRDGRFNQCRMKCAAAWREVPSLPDMFRVPDASVPLRRSLGPPANRHK